jgi:dihydropteroate synthase
MSYQQASSPEIDVLVPVSTAAEAAEAARAGARLVDTGADGSLTAAIRRAGLAVLICGPGDEADLGRDLEGAIRNGAGVICSVVADAERAVREGIARERVFIQVTPGELATARADGWRTLVDVDGEGAAGANAAARAGAVAAVCAWQGAAIIRTRYVTQVRRCLNMTESILGTRPPAWAVRGLA